MDILEAMRARHAVRAYDERPVEPGAWEELRRCIDSCNRESGLHLQLVLGEAKAFEGFMAHYGKFRGVRNYIAVVGKQSGDFEERCGYYGEQAVLRAQQLDLNTCWVAATYHKEKKAYQVGEGEKLLCVIAVGYGMTQGVPHKNKPMAELCRVDGAMPGWFQKGMEAAMLAPTARNQQKFRFTLENGAVTAAPGAGFYTKLDLGIVKYHFEVGAGLVRGTLAPGK